MIGHVARPAMTVLTSVQLAVIEFLVVGPGKRQAGNHQKKRSAKRQYLHNSFV
jgi:hypothetical protein